MQGDADVDRQRPSGYPAGWLVSAGRAARGEDRDQERSRYSPAQGAARHGTGVPLLKRLNTNGAMLGSPLESIE
jgi:hypothetical protein